LILGVRFEESIVTSCFVRRGPWKFAGAWLEPANQLARSLEYALGGVLSLKIIPRVILSTSDASGSRSCFLGGKLDDNLTESIRYHRV
jgi:hypothetical protein